MNRYTMRVWRELRRAQIPGAASAVASWGFPRELDQDDTEGCIWARFGRDVLVWLGPLTDPRTWHVHVCVAPWTREHAGLDARRFLLGLEVIATYLGASKLVGLPYLDLEHEELVAAYGKMVGYYPRAGWVWDRALHAWTRDLLHPPRSMRCGRITQAAARAGAGPTDDRQPSD